MTSYIKSLQAPGQKQDFIDIRSGLALDLGTNINGITVNEKTVRKNAVVNACVGKIKAAISQLEINIYDSSGNKAKNENLNRIFNHFINDYMSIQTFIERIVDDLSFTGNFYAIPVINSRGKLVELNAVGNSKAITVKSQGDGTPEYKLTALNGEYTYSSNEIVHIKHSTPHGYHTSKPIYLDCIDSIEINMACQKFQETFFNNSATPTGFLTTDNKLSQNAQQNLRDSWDSYYRGVKNSNKVAILEEGLRFEGLSINNRESQLLELQRESKIAICNAFRVPPELLSTDTGINSSSREMNMMFYTDTIMPLTRKIEDEFNKILLKSGYYVKFDTSNFLRGDDLSQAQAVEKLMMTNVITVNEARQKLGFPPIEGGDVRSDSSSTVRTNNGKENQES